MRKHKILLLNLNILLVSLNLFAAEPTEESDLALDAPKRAGSVQRNSIRHEEDLAKLINNLQSNFHNFSDGHHGQRELKKNKLQLKKLIQAAFNEDYAQTLLGYLEMATECYTEALDLLKDRDLPKKTQKKLNKHILYFNIGTDPDEDTDFDLFSTLSQQDTAAILESLREIVTPNHEESAGENKKNGSERNQQDLNQPSSYDDPTPAKNIGRAYLEHRAKKGDRHAQKMLNRAALERVLGFNKTTGRAYLEERVKAGDRHAQKMLNRAALERVLGFNKTIGRAYLEERVKSGDQHAQKRLNEAALDEVLGFSKTTGRAYLEDRVKAGDQHAQKILNETIDYLDSNEDLKSADLEGSEIARDQDAQKNLDIVACRRVLISRDKATKRDLEKRAKEGDLDLQELLVVLLNYNQWFFYLYNNVMGYEQN